MAALEVDIAGLTLKNPVLTASGTFGYALEFEEFYDVSELGGICTKGLSLEPRLGNAPERICETAAGMLNAIGLANVGVEAFCTEKLPKLRQRNVTTVANIFASSLEDFVTLAKRLDREEGVAALELNVSCPNVKEGGIEFGKDPAQCAAVTRAVRAATKLPIWVKMSPEAGDILAVGKACEEAGADALTAINTVRGTAIDIHSERPRLANATGGLSGPALKPIALRVVWQLYQAVKIPIIGIGGIANTRDAIEFLMAGASAIQVGTANFSNPHAAKQILDGLHSYAGERGIAIRDLIGKAQR
jgi:dihydroorotate dehydrogenase (NAD+) catalytic subunit